jgi:DnaJ-class molecular chaperone
MPTHYETLGVSKDASESEIKKAYRALSLKYHPDRNPDPAVQEKYKAINDAYDILSDSQTKQQYDHELQFGAGFHPMGPGGMGPGGMGGDDIQQFFNMMFGGPFGGMPGMQGMDGPGIRIFHSGPGGPFPGGFHQFPGGGFQQKPAPIIKTVEVTMEQIYHGASIQIQIERQVTQNMIRYNETLPISITIPRGIEDNECMIIRGQGHSISDDMAGDIKVTFSMINDTVFKRQGQDIVYTKQLTLKEALCGFAFEIKHLNGKTLNMSNVSNVAVIKPNFKKVVPGLGFVKNGQTGNLIIELLVDFPDSLTPEQIDKLREIL